METYRKTQAILGGIMDPHAAYLHLRGLKTLHLRVARQNATALEMARRLDAHPKVCGPFLYSFSIVQLH